MKHRSTSTYLALACAAFLALFACASLDGTRASVAPQQWNDSRGPVVPHDTFPTDCALCHEGSSWQKIRDDFRFDHARETGVALLGAHASAECLRCHNDRGPVEVFAQRGCVGCHEDVHQTKLGTNCADCHDETSWLPREQIAKHNRTRFPLVGAHAATACFACHPGAQAQQFDRADTQCIACHASDLRLATSPDHVAQGWIDGCDRCHVPTSWGGAGFNHGFFPLTGAHQPLACASCHAGDVFSGTPSDCYACHQDDYRGASDPNHVAAGFPTDCSQCHSTSDWDGASFAHTAWRLTGAHASTACLQCHANNVFDGTPTDCFACHQDDYRGTTEPNHATSGFPTTCASCHSTSTWRDASFSHRGISNGCAVCHQDDYDGTNDPNHAAAGFPTSCELCHDTNDWDGADFDHDFPIDSGDHKNLACADCHLAPSSFRTFSCTHCHAHNQREMNDEHDRVPDYVWQSSACYACHPNGQKD